MKPRALSWGIVSIFIICTCVTLLSTSASLWFLAALLGDFSGEYSFGYYNTFIESKQLTLPIPKFSSDYNRLVYKKDQYGEYIAGIPRLRNQFSIIQDLKKQQWEVRRLGWIVIASNADSPMAPPHRRVLAAAGKMLRAITLDRLPLYPLAMVQVESKGTDPFSAYVKESRKVIQAVINTESSHFLRSIIYRSSSDTALGGSSYVALHRDLLHLIPSSVRDSLERKVADSLGFKKTHPKILQSFLAHGSVVLFDEGNLFAIGIVSSDASAATQVEEWMHAEQGMRHPLRRAFKLPDKTIGYEYVPGGSNAYFSIDKGISNCFPSENYDELIFLCGKDKTLVISNDEQSGNRLVSSIENISTVQRGVIQENIVNAIGLGDQIEKIEYGISGHAIQLWADKKL